MAQVGKLLGSAEDRRLFNKLHILTVDVRGTQNSTQEKSCDLPYSLLLRYLIILSIEIPGAIGLQYDEHPAFILRKAMVYTPSKIPQTIYVAACEYNSTFAF